MFVPVGTGAKRSGKNGAFSLARQQQEKKEDASNGKCQTSSAVHLYPKQFITRTDEVYRIGRDDFHVVPK